MSPPYDCRFRSASIDATGVSRAIDSVEPVPTVWEVGLSPRSFTTMADFEKDGLDDLLILPTRRAPELDGARRAVILGSAPLAGLTLTGPVLSIGVQSTAGHVVSYEGLGGRLDIDGATEVHVAVTWQVGAQGTNTAYDS